MKSENQPQGLAEELRNPTSTGRLIGTQGGLRPEALPIHVPLSSWLSLSALILGLMFSRLQGLLSNVTTVPWLTQARRFVFTFVLFLFKGTDLLASVLETLGMSFLFPRNLIAFLVLHHSPANSKHMS